jgi:N-acetylglucosamine-6-sulfatase
MIQSSGVNPTPVKFDKKRAAVFATVVLILLAMMDLSSARGKAGRAKPPNIVFILTDDQRLDDIAYMPKLERLITNRGISFQNYFTTVSLCCPARTAILRGQYAHNTGVLTNEPPLGGFQLAHSFGLERSTIATWLHDAGYKTALIGKYLNKYPGDAGATYIPPGWDYWVSPSDMNGAPYKEYDYTLNDNGDLVHHGRKPEDYGTDVYTGKATDFIKACAAEDKPFFLYLAFYAPHEPATVAPRYESLFRDSQVPRTKAFNENDVSKKPQYIRDLQPLTSAEIENEDAFCGKRRASLQAVDDAIETIHDVLRKTEQLETTYIVFSSDNGFHLGEHRLRRGKQSAYEVDIHLPLIICGPGIGAGTKSVAVTGNIDLAPTFAELAGAKLPSFVDGRSLVPLLHGHNATTWRNAYLIEHWTNNSHVRRGKRRRMLTRRPGPADRIPEFHALRDKDSIYIEYGTGEKESYHVSSDPDEVANEAGTINFPGRSEHLHELAKVGGASARRIENQPQR